MTLLAELNSFKNEFLMKFPKDKAKIMADADEELIASNFLAKALKTGDTVANFILPDASGRLVSLYETLKQGPVILVFYRGGWCPYCNLELRAYQRLLPQIRDAGVQLMAISSQSPDASLSTQEKNALAYPVLSDGRNSAASSFGILFKLPPTLAALYKELGHDLPKLHSAGTWELPVPATYVISQNHTILHHDVDVDYRKRMEPADALAVITALKKVA